MSGTIYVIASTHRRSSGQKHTRSISEDVVVAVQLRKALNLTSTLKENLCNVLFVKEKSIRMLQSVIQQELNFLQENLVMFIQVILELLTNRHVS